MNNLTGEGRYSTEANILNAPSAHSGNVIVLKRNARIIQIWISNQDTSPTLSYIRVFISSWGNWEQYSTDIPSFYKDYATLNSLSDAVTSHNGVRRFSFTFEANSIPEGTIDIGTSSPLLHISLANSGETAVFLVPYWSNNGVLIANTEQTNHYEITRGVDGASKSLVKIKCNEQQTARGSINIVCIGSFSGW